MTPDQIQKLATTFKQSIPDNGGDTERDFAEGMIELLCAFVCAQTQTAEQVERMANAMVAQTQMLAVVYNLSEDKMDAINATLEPNKEAV